MWIYCGGRTSRVVAEEIEGSTGIKVCGVGTVKELLDGNIYKVSGGKEVYGVIVTEVTQQGENSLREVKMLGGLYKTDKVYVVTSEELEEEGNVNVIQTDKVRVGTLIQIVNRGW